MHKNMLILNSLLLPLRVPGFLSFLVLRVSLAYSHRQEAHDYFCYLLFSDSPTQVYTPLTAQFQDSSWHSSHFDEQLVGVVR